eukprot:tig00020563_g11278.t1
MILASAGPPSKELGSVSAVRALRVLRVARVFRLFARTRGLLLLFETIMGCLPQLAEVTAAFALLFFVYAVLGVQAFGQAPWSGPLSEHVNFSNVGYATLTLFRMITGENWNEIMWAIASPDACPGDGAGGGTGGGGGTGVGAGGGGDCGLPSAILYFASWMWVAQVVYLNLFVAVVIDRFAVNVRQRFYLVRHRDVRAFLRAWERHDPTASGFVSAPRVLPALLREVGLPLGLGPNADRLETYRFLTSLHIPTVGDGVHVHYKILLHALVDRAYLLSLVPLVPEIEERARFEYMEGCPVLRHFSAPGALADAPTVAEAFAAVCLQARWRGIVARRRQAAQAARRPSAAPAPASDEGEEEEEGEELEEGYGDESPRARGGQEEEGAEGGDEESPAPGSERRASTASGSGAGARGPPSLLLTAPTAESAGLAPPTPTARSARAMEAKLARCEAANPDDYDRSARPRRDG